jgi:hypothetical protein
MVAATQSSVAAAACRDAFAFSVSHYSMILSRSMTRPLHYASINWSARRLKAQASILPHRERVAGAKGTQFYEALAGHP